MVFSPETFAAFSKALAIMHRESDAEDRAAPLLAELKMVFKASDITLTEPAASDVIAPGDHTLVVPVQGTSLRLILQREEPFGRSDHFLGALLGAHLQRAFAPFAAPTLLASSPGEKLTSFTALGLTPRECEILHWIRQGKRDAEIAELVGAAVRTVNKHVENILRKLGTETRSGAARIASDAVTHYPGKPPSAAHVVKNDRSRTRRGP